MPGDAVALDVDQVAAEVVGGRAEEVVEADVVERGRAREARDVAAELGALAVGLHDHRERVPADDRADPVLEAGLARRLLLVVRVDRVDVGGGGLVGQVHARAPRLVDQPLDQEVRALRALALRAPTSSASSHSRVSCGIDVVVGDRPSRLVRVSGAPCGRARSPQPLEILIGVIGRAREREKRHQQEAARERRLAVALELGGRDVARHRRVARRRAQVLADRDEVDVGVAQVVDHGEHLVRLLAEADHHAGLGEGRGLHVLHARAAGRASARSSRRAGSAGRGAAPSRRCGCRRRAARPRRARSRPACGGSRA